MEKEKESNCSATDLSFFTIMEIILYQMLENRVEKLQLLEDFRVAIERALFVSSIQQSIDLLNAN